MSNHVPLPSMDGDSHNTLQQLSVSSLRKNRAQFTPVEVNHEPYEYQKLAPSSTSFRLFFLFGGVEQGSTAPIVGSLFEADLADPPTYECLTSTWGTGAKIQKIYVDGRVLCVTGDLLAALGHLRGRERVRVPTWID